jgi:hypothetical protein
VLVVIAPLLDTIMIWLTLLIDEVLAVCDFSASPFIALTDAVISVVSGRWSTSPTTIWPAWIAEFSCALV